jgi:dihydroxy-acid dehydratase
MPNVKSENGLKFAPRHLESAATREGKCMCAKTFRKDQRPWSSVKVDGIEQAPRRSMLRAVGFSDADLKKPHIGIASTWSAASPCHLQLSTLAGETEKGVGVAGGKAIAFSTIPVSHGMKYSLVSREIIADSLESVAVWEGFDGIVAFGGCDKNIPGCLIALARLNRPAVFVYGGGIVPGCHCDKKVDLLSVCEALGRYAKGDLSSKELSKVERAIASGESSCDGMYSAITMACVIEALGLSLPNSSARMAASKEKLEESHAAGRAVMRLVERGIRPSDILTRQAFLNAVATVTALGGSTNVVLHLLAMAQAVRVRLSLSDFVAIGKRVPVVANLKPCGTHEMAELASIGGIAPLMARLLKEGFLCGDCLTVTGKTLQENLALVKPYPRKQELIRPFSRPVKKSGPLMVLKGNLAPDGAVARSFGTEGERFSGKAIVFNSEERALKKILDGSVKKGHVVVIRYEGPRGGPGMREMLAPASAIMGRGLDRDVALISDGRFADGSLGLVVGHVAPEAYMGGPLAIVRNGDVITINFKKCSVQLELSDAEISGRLSQWKVPRPRHKTGVLSKYAKLVGSASEGAVTC